MVTTTEWTKTFMETDRDISEWCHSKPNTLSCYCYALDVVWCLRWCTCSAMVEEIELRGHWYGLSKHIGPNVVKLKSCSPAYSSWLGPYSSSFWPGKEITPVTSWCLAGRYCGHQEVILLTEKGSGKRERESADKVEGKVQICLNTVTPELGAMSLHHINIQHREEPSWALKGPGSNTLC